MCKRFCLQAHYSSPLPVEHPVDHLDEMRQVPFFMFKPAHEYRFFGGEEFF
jgi:hypothetical protein